MIRIVRDSKGRSIEGVLVPMGLKYPKTPMYDFDGKCIDEICIPQNYLDEGYTKAVRVKSVDPRFMEFILEK